MRRLKDGEKVYKNSEIWECIDSWSQEWALANLEYLLKEFRSLNPGKISRMGRDKNGSYITTQDLRTVFEYYGAGYMLAGNLPDYLTEDVIYRNIRIEDYHCNPQYDNTWVVLVEFDKWKNYIVVETRTREEAEQWVAEWKAKHPEQG